MELTRRTRLGVTVEPVQPASPIQILKHCVNTTVYRKRTNISLESLTKTRFYLNGTWMKMESYI